MEEMQPLETTEETTEEITDKLNDEVEDQIDQIEVRQPIPFGEDGAAFLRNLTQHAVFLGFAMLLLMFIRIFGQ
jgi:hypothetical protein